MFSSLSGPFGPTLGAPNTAGGSPPVITTASLPNAVVGTAYSQTLTATGASPITWSIVSGSISPLTLNSSTGAITGTPSTATTLSATFRATNAVGYDERLFTILVNASGTLPLIQPSDFTFIGYYDLNTNGLDSPYTSGLAVRRVGSEVRLLSKHYVGNTIIEYTLSGKTPATSGSPSSCQITSTTRTWANTIPSVDALYWDSVGSRLFTVSCVDYPNDVQELDTRFYSATLTDGTGTTNVKRLKLDGVPDRRAYSGIVSVPSSFQSTYSVGPFAIGMGGYTSRMDQRGQCAMGLSLYGIPDPAPFANDTSLTTAQYKVLAARGTSPYGRSLELPTNEYTPGQWQSPGPDGLGYWVWGNKYNGGFFIDGPTKRGLVSIAFLGTGRNWYETSTLHRSGSVWEAHIYNPDDLGRISQGTQSAVLDPVAANMRSLSETRKITADDGQNPGSYSAYDEVNKVLYIMVMGGRPDNTYWNRIYAYSVNV